LPDGSVVAVEEGGLARVVRRSGVLLVDERLGGGCAAERVAAGGGVVAVTDGQRLTVSEDGGRTFRAAAGRPLPGPVVDLAVDASGELWIWTGLGVQVVDPDGERRLVVRRPPPSPSARIAVGDGDSIFLVEDGELLRVDLSCGATAAGLPPPSSTAVPRPPPELRTGPRGPAAVAGWLPAVLVELGAGPGRVALWLELVWPLHRPLPADLAGWHDVGLEAREERRARHAARLEAFRRWREGRSALGARWPPGSREVLESATEALCARAELALDALDP
jgi:hypothetical protein